MKIEDLNIEKELVITEQDALLVVDMQYDFLPGGSLAVEEGDEIIEGINNVINIFNKNKAKIILTQDWHPKEHLSFASKHEGKNPGDEYSSEDGAIGPVTQQAVNNCFPQIVRQKMVGARLRFMTNLANWPSFSKGWARRIASILEM